MKKLGADAMVEAHALCDNLYVGAHPLAQGRDLVDKRHFRGEKRIGGILDHFGRRDIRKDEGRFEQVERPV